MAERPGDVGRRFDDALNLLVNASRVSPPLRSAVATVEAELLRLRAEVDFWETTSTRPTMDPNLSLAIHESLFVDAGMGQREAITDAYTPEGQAICFVRNLNARGYRVVPIAPFDSGARERHADPSSSGSHPPEATP